MLPVNEDTEKGMGTNQNNSTISIKGNNDNHHDKQNKDGVQVDANAWTAETKIQRLYINIKDKMFNTSMLLPLVQRSPRLKRLDLHWVNCQQTIDGVADLVQNEFLPHLNEIRFASQQFVLDLDLVKLMSNLSGDCRAATSATTAAATATGTKTEIRRFMSIETYCHTLGSDWISQTHTNHHGHTL
ncbi:hypothetical protein BGZ50_008554 [Haplosporangium sp. Z 11]|nr:hypothetical protein BGZ50_008554 [Haplosporangium sp. Z 11]